MFPFGTVSGRNHTDTCAGVAMISHAARARRSQRSRKVVADGKARVLIPPSPRRCSFVPSVTTPLYSTTVSQALRQTLRRSFPTSSWTNAQDSPTKEVSDVCLCSWNYSSPYDFLHGDDDLGLASDVGFLEEVEPNDSESLLVVHAPKRKDDHILWAMTVSSPAPDGRVVSVILSSPSFLRLVPCPWVASSMSF